MTWRIELSRAAVRTLRSLPRKDQRIIAHRIRHMEEAGVPPRARREGEAHLVLAGEHILVCLETPGSGTRGSVILVVTLRPGAGLAPTGLRQLVKQWLLTLVSGGWMETLAQDVRFALRSLKKSPGFSSVAILTLALGIGSATAIFSVANGVLLKPLPYEDPREVVTVWASWDNFPDKTWLSVPEFQLYHQENRVFEDMALYGRSTATFTDPQNPEQVGSAMFTPNLFGVLGVEPILGRVPTWEEARDSAPPIMIGYGAWQRRWGGDPDLLGSTVEVDGSLMPVVGILPGGFTLPVDYSASNVSEIFVPGYVDLESPAPPLGSGGSHGYFAVARLLEGVTVEEARSDLQRVQARVEPNGLYAPERRFTPRVFAAVQDIVGGARGTILLLMGAVGFVLLIACGNVANLLLARGEGRMTEVAVRSAVGAGRGRILRQLLTENGILALLGGGLGVVLAHLGVQALLRIDPDAVPRAAAVTTDVLVLGFALAASLVTAVLFGALPALRVFQRRRGASLHLGARGAGGVSTRLQGFLVAFQMAMAVVLLMGSGLMIRTFLNLLEVNPGFRPERVLTAQVTVPSGSYPTTEEVVGFYRELLRTLREIPGVEAAGAARLLPLASTMGDAGVRVDGYVPAPAESMQAEWQYVTPGYLEVMKIPLLEGRTFDEGDRPGSEEVVIINESLARHYWGDESPLGASATLRGEEATVVGVVADVVHNSLTGGAKDRFYRPHAQVSGFGHRSMTLTVQSRTEPLALLESVRAAVRGLEPSIPLARIQTMDEVMAASMAQPRFALVLLGAFSILALILALVGIYGVIAYAVSRRTREIGIRMALGARSGTVVGLMVRQGMLMALIGVVVGTVAALTMGRLIQSLLYGVEPQDPTTMITVPTLFLAVAVLACWLPAARAARVDPSSALRWE